jgi:hypothetical protein
MRAQRPLGAFLGGATMAAALVACSFVTQLAPTPKPSFSCGSSTRSVDYEQLTVEKLASFGAAPRPT